MVLARPQSTLMEGSRIKSRAGGAKNFKRRTSTNPHRRIRANTPSHLSSGRESRQDHHDSPSPPSTHTAGPVTTTSRPTAQDLCQYPFGIRSWLSLAASFETLLAEEEARTAKQTIAPAKPTPNPSSSRSSSSNFFFSLLAAFPLDYVPRSSSRVANNDSIPQSWVRRSISPAMN